MFLITSYIFSKIILKYAQVFKLQIELLNLIIMNLTQLPLKKLDPFVFFFIAHRASQVLNFLYTIPVQILLREKKITCLNQFKFSFKMNA